MLCGSVVQKENIIMGVCDEPNVKYLGTTNDVDIKCPKCKKINTARIKIY
jgi:hypothetical protein